MEEWWSRRFGKVLETIPLFTTFDVEIRENGILSITKKRGVRHELIHSSYQFLGKGKKKDTISIKYEQGYNKHIISGTISEILSALRRNYIIRSYSYYSWKQLLNYYWAKEYDPKLLTETPKLIKKYNTGNRIFYDGKIINFYIKHLSNGIILEFPAGIHKREKMVLLGRFKILSFERSREKYPNYNIFKISINDEIIEGTFNQLFRSLSFCHFGNGLMNVLKEMLNTFEKEMSNSRKK